MPLWDYIGHEQKKQMAALLRPSMIDTPSLKECYVIPCSDGGFQLLRTGRRVESLLPFSEQLKAASESSWLLMRILVSPSGEFLEIRISDFHCEQSVRLPKEAVANVAKEVGLSDLGPAQEAPSLRGPRM